MADQDNNNNNNVEITPGTPEFEKMVFRLNQALNAENVQSLNYNGNQLQKIQDNVYVMPAYVAKDFNLFFIVADLIQGDWVIAFATADIKDGKEVTDLSEPMSTGKGLNMLGEHSPNDANQLLKYFNTLNQANYGEWRLIK